ncbi:hypothetical protein [Kangiella sp. TOML190]|uniref:hypothetical protein n=1 Tax=Kangiella sp. TOML190 TaxID=2931351 RepID=UPI00203DD902|nr:hypothetical protein [Kangiella sp. TOML190]
MIFRRAVVKQLSNKNLILLLLLAAVLLALHSYFANLLVNYQSTRFYQQQQQASQQQIVDEAKTQLSPSLSSLDIDSLTQASQQIAGLELVEAIRVFDINGQQLYPTTFEADLNSNENTKASELVLDGEIYGYLLLAFTHPTANQFQAQYWLYISALLLWLLFAALLIGLKRSSKTRAVTTEANAPSVSKITPKQELQQLLKRNKKQKIETPVEALLIISANWESLPIRTELVSLLNRWTAHAKAIIMEFDSDLLQLGLTESLSNQQLQQIQALELSLQQLKLKPTLLIHSLSFSQSIYQHFFQVVSTGIWTEHHLEPGEIATESNEQATTEVIEIDIEDIGIVELIKLPKIKAEQSMAIERQSRFYLQ